MRIAIFQSAGKVCDIAYNIEQIRKAAQRATEQGARLLICPELYLSGYNIGDAIFELAEPVNGSSAQQLAKVAAERHIALLYGYPERADNVVYNSACLIERNGQAIANYRKTHLYAAEEKRLFKPGNELVRVKIDDFTLGLLICYDVEFPEAVRTHALTGVDLVAVPTALMQPQDFIAETMVPTRAFENQVFVAYVNRCGRERELIYCGKSCVVGPNGKDLARAGLGEELLIADLDRERYQEWRELIPYMQDRRDILLKKLAMFLLV